MENLSEMNLFLFLLSETICLATGCLLSVLPHITRKSLLFGVRIPEDAKSDPDVIMVKRRYTTIMIVITLILLAGGGWLYYIRPDSMLLLSLYQPSILLLAQFAVYIPLWRTASRMKVQKGWKVSHIGTSQTAASGIKGRLKDLPWIWYAVSAALCALTVILGLAVYSSMPDTIATHWDANMTADIWSQKSLMDVFIMPIISSGMILLMLGSNIVIFYTKLQVSLENPVLSYAQHRLYRRLISHMLGFVTLMITLMFVLMTPMILNLYIPSTSVLYGGILILTILILIPSIWVPVKAGQGGSKLNPVLTAQEEKEMKNFSKLSFRPSVDRGDDSYWILGLFYYNRGDPSLFVEDRFGNNGGFNLAKTAGKIIAASIAVLVIATYVFSTILFAVIM